MTGKLVELYKQHQGLVSDKWSSYLNEYQRVFSTLRNKQITLLEVGIQNGGSLEIWANYFTRAKHIIGCDINEACGKLRYTSPAVSVVTGNITDQSTHDKILTIAASRFDAVIDDGSHTSQDIINTFLRFFPHVKPSGIFIAEDLHCSYWPEFNGGINNAASSMNFFKALSDVVNFEHWRHSPSRSEYIKNLFSMYDFSMTNDFEKLLASIHSIEFVNSMCFIRKSKNSTSSLGPRFIAGSIELICPISQKSGKLITDE